MTLNCTLEEIQLEQRAQHELFTQYFVKPARSQSRTQTTSFLFLENVRSPGDSDMGSTGNKMHSLNKSMLSHLESAYRDKDMDKHIESKLLYASPTKTHS